jgi:hypothetical protein
MVDGAAAGSSTDGPDVRGAAAPDCEEVVSDFDVRASLSAASIAAEAAVS